MKQNRKRKQSCMHVLTGKDEDEEGQVLALDGDEKRLWVKDEAAVDSGATACVASRRKYPHIMVQPTPASQRGESWMAAGVPGFPRKVKSL